MALPSISVNPQNISTPKRIINKRILTETPECFAPVILETPNVATKKINRENSVEISNLTVAVRVRPMSAKELDHVSSAMIVRVQNNELFIRTTPVGAVGIGTDHLFQYDHIFWSCDEKSKSFSSQKDVFNSLGRPLLTNAFQGYNACLFAYGQTGSGKTYSMMGPENEIDSEENAGIIPRFCRELYHQISERSLIQNITVEVSYFEIYNEKIHDLLVVDNTKSLKERPALKVREHPILGPYVVNLSVHVVRSYEELRSWLLLGIKNRTTATTFMNEKSSRSHSIFSIELSFSEGKNSDTAKRSKISLIDLAGSERIGNNYNCEERMKQGVSINKSLLTLGKVISALAEQRKGNQFIPYRESVLTWLLRESLGGNSHTTMLATISPSNAHSEETLSTLRYACQARSIVNRARVNEDPNDRLIRELRAEVERLRALKSDYEKSSNSSTSSSIQIDDDSYSSKSSQELQRLFKETEEKLLIAQKEWEENFIETKKKKMKELLEVEKQKEELESHVRILGNLDTGCSNVSPYKTKFLDELEDILTLNDKSNEDDLQMFKNFCERKGYLYEINTNLVFITDSINKANCTCIVSDLKALKNEDQLIDKMKSLSWTFDENKNSNRRLSKGEVCGPLMQIYDALNALKFVTEEDETTRLAFAKFCKSFQCFEAALNSKLNRGNNELKTVCFRL